MYHRCGNNHLITYFKSSTHIEDLLTLIGAPGRALEIMSAKIEKEMRNTVNRRVNCDAANLYHSCLVSKYPAALTCRCSRRSWPAHPAKTPVLAQLLDMALQVNVVKKSGSWFTYGGDQLGQGRENVRQFLKDNPELTEEIENKVKAEFGLIEPTDQFAEDGNEASASNATSEEKAKADAGKPEAAKGAAKASKSAGKA